MIQLTGTMKQVVIYIAGLVVVALILWMAVSYFMQRAAIANLNKEKIELKQKEMQIVDSYNQELGKAKANELAAREDKMKSDALIGEYEKRIGNVKALDQKLEAVEAKHEQAKQQLGDCPNQEECLRLLCLELAAAGFKVNCK
jgi:biopolymer transport protein ExbB/TolQ